MSYHLRSSHGVIYGDIKDRNEYSSNFHYKFYRTSLNINWLVGDKQNWMIGANIEYGILYYFKQVENRETTYSNGTTSRIGLSYKYLTPQTIFWTGMNFGRSFKINELIDFSVVFNTKISSPISGRPSENSTVKTRDRSLVVKTLNFNFSLKL